MTLSVFQSNNQSDIEKLGVEQFSCHQPAGVGTLQAGLVLSSHKKHMHDCLKESLNSFEIQCQTH